MKAGHVAAAALVAEALAIDLVLIRCENDVISTCVRRSFLAKCIVTYLAAHLLWTIPGDPLSRLGGAVRKAATDGVIP